MLLNITTKLLLFFCSEAIPVGIGMQRHNSIDIGILFHKLTLQRGINVLLLHLAAQ